MSLEGRSIWITGGASGIGAATARLVGERGEQLVQGQPHLRVGQPARHDRNSSTASATPRGSSMCTK